MTNSDSGLKKETLVFIQGNQSLTSDENSVYPLTLVANISNPATSDIITSQQNELSKISPSSVSTRLPFLSDSYPFPNPDMLASAEYSIVLDDGDANITEDTPTANAKSRKLPCSKCSYQTMDKTSLERHMRKHNSIFVCKVCKIHFPSVSSLIDHYSKRHLSEGEENTGAQHFCPMCPFSSMEKREYDKHITRHETAAYICQICGQPFAKQVSMKWHVKFKHDINTDEDDKMMSDEPPGGMENVSVKLEADQMEPISMEELQSEFLEEAEEQDIKPFAKRFSCMFCPKSFSTKLVLRYHAWRSHRERLQMSQIEETEGLSEELVPAAKTSAKNWFPLKRVKTSHQSNSFQYQCPVCTFSTIYKSTLDRHIKKHGEAKFDCEICGMPFTVIGNLTHHKKVHHPDLMPATFTLPKQHKCSLCVYNTSYKSTLERHLRTHGIAKYHCDLCTMPFVFTGSFVTHRELKHQIMSKDCQETVFTDKLTEDSDLCGGKFLKRRRCPYCNANMSSASKLNRHLRTHKNAGYYCGSCSIFFHQRSDFENHMRNHLRSRILENQPNQNTSQSPARMSQQVSAGNPSVEFDTSNSRSIQNEHRLVTDDLSSFHNVISETSNLNDLPNSMVKMYNNQMATEQSDMSKDMVKIDLTEQELLKAGLLSRHTVSPSEANRHFGESNDSSLKIVSTCGSADQHILGSSTMVDQRSMQNMYNPNSGLSEQGYPIVSQEDNFQLENSNFFSSQRTDFNIDQQTFVTQVYAANNQNYDMPQSESFTVNRDTPKQQQQQQQQQQHFMPQNPADQNLHREVTNVSHCNQHALNRTDGDGDLCACKMLRPVHGEVLANPPVKGRYAKLVSDFDDFAQRPFACSLCFFRCSILKDLYNHVQNHLTGCNMTPTPVSAKFNTGNYLQNLAQQVDGPVPDIEYID